MFDWIRRKVKDAVLSGVGDALEYLQAQGAPDDDAQRLLEERVRLLPAPDQERPDRRRGRA